jgi:hypothetical protein
VRGMSCLRGSSGDVQPLGEVRLPVSPSRVADDARSGSAPGDDAASSLEVPSVQHPILTGHDGGAQHAVTAWEGRAQVAMAVFIDRYLSENPCPGFSSHVACYERWSETLRASGEARLEATRERRLRSA